jgi:hypothetical protein
MSDERSFDPAKYLTKVQGRDYLEVKWRLVWLRTEHPNASISTRLEHRDSNEAIFSASVVLQTGGSATGWGSETPGDFGDYLEKAETKALGRALAALGFGTQFCNDHDFGADAGRVVDAPVGIRSNAARQPGSGQPPTEKQLGFLQRLARESGLHSTQVEDLAQSMFGRPVEELDRRGISSLIEMIQTTEAEKTAFANGSDSRAADAPVAADEEPEIDLADAVTAVKQQVANATDLDELRTAYRLAKAYGVLDDAEITGVIDEAQKRLSGKLAVTALTT